MEFLFKEKQKIHYEIIYDKETVTKYSFAFKEKEIYFDLNALSLSSYKKTN